MDCDLLCAASQQKQVTSHTQHPESQNGISNLRRWIYGRTSDKLPCLPGLVIIHRSFLQQRFCNLIIVLAKLYPITCTWPHACVFTVWLRLQYVHLSTESPIRYPRQHAGHLDLSLSGMQDCALHSPSGSYRKICEALVPGTMNLWNSMPKCFRRASASARLATAKAAHTTPALSLRSAA